MSDKEEIKRLAKKTLEEKWYPALEDYSIDVSDSCAFCYDAEKRKREDPLSEPWYANCHFCLINKYSDILCGEIYTDMPREEKLVIIKHLEKLAKDGEL